MVLSREKEMQKMTSKAAMVYDLIQSKASGNELMPGNSRVSGMLNMDAGVIFTYYGSMLNEIRSICGKAAGLCGGCER